MTDTKNAFLDGSIIELFLTRSQGDWGVTCRAFRESDEQMTEFDVESLSMRGAQREMTSWLVTQGYSAAGRWTTETDGPNGTETSRKFRPTRAE